MSEQRAPARPTEQRPPQDAGDAEQVAQRKRKAADRERLRIAGLKRIVEHEDSRTWLWDLLGFCGIARSSFTGNSETFFREGARNVGLKVQAELVKHCPESYITMMKEGEINAP